MSVLRIPEDQARALLAQRILLGRNWHRAASQVRGAGWHVRDLEHRIQDWRDFNCAWLDKYLGGEASDKYRTASTPAHNSSSDDLGARLAIEVAEELETLEWIISRLPLWVPTSHAAPATSRYPRSSRDAPIFIVHGSDTLRAESVAHTVTRMTGRETIILREQPNSGRTLIEKFERHAAEVSYAIIVLTPDDKGSRGDEMHARPRGRQNVIFEMGYFYGLIGRDHVSVLLRPGVEKPSDVDGIAYITFDNDGAWKSELLRELRHAGFDVRL